MIKKKPVHHKTKVYKKSKRFNFATPLIILGLITLGVMAWYSKPSPTPLQINVVGESDGNIELSLTPATKTVTPNTKVDLTLTANVTGTAKLDGIDAELTYSGVCGTPVVTQGTFLANSLSAAKVESGSIKFSYSKPTNVAEIIGSGPVATISLTPTLVGECTFAFTENTLVASIDKVTNDLKSATGSTITIAAAEASATASASPSTTPEKPAKPTGLRSNCFDGGNKITLRWDSVSGADSYKLRLDQKDGTGDKSVDGLTKTESEQSIIPDQKYSWWVHASKSGVDSEEAKINEVVCAKTTTTSTATPTPTPTSTPKTTVKPTVKPTATPKATVKASSSPTTSIIPIASPASFGSLNDIFTDKDAVTDAPKSTAKPSFFAQISLGWQAIFTQLALLFK
jgi:hypothetical protein